MYNKMDIIEHKLGETYCYGLDNYDNLPPKYIEIVGPNNIIYDGRIIIPDNEDENLYLEPHLTQQQKNDIIRSNYVIVKERSKIIWSSDEDCVGKEDPVSYEPIPNGRGFKLEAENDYCYDVETLSSIKRTNRQPVGPRTRNPFTENDIERINAYQRLSSGGKNKKNKTNKTNKKRKSIHKKRNHSIIKKRKTMKRYK